MFKSLFSYYGSKSKIIHNYPKPSYDTIVEPFAGSAAYSLRYCNRNIILNELDYRVYSIWCFLLSSDALDIAHKYLDGLSVKAGDSIENIAQECPHPGFIEYLRAEANHGSQGTGKCGRKIITMFGAKAWHRILPKLDYFIPKIKHWKIINGTYEGLPNIEATWFIDPPYDGVRGKEYRCNTVNYNNLGEWCKNRIGQVIVCENTMAQWLPFEPLCKTGSAAYKDKYRVAPVEAMFYIRYHNE